MEMIEVKTAELIGPALDWLAGTSCGVPMGVFSGVVYRKDLPGDTYGPGPLWYPSADWAQGGPIIEKFILGLKFCVFELPNESWKAETHESWANGSTALIASMRAIVHANFGDIVSVPKELMQ